MNTLPYHEGSFFGVPLRQGGYGGGLVARMAPKGRIVLIHVFRSKFDVVPNLPDLVSLRPADTATCLRVGDLGLLNGKWPILGEVTNWTRDEWPIPSFLRRDDLAKRAWRVDYNDSDPSLLEREEPTQYDIEGLESAGLYGYGAAEILITKLLNTTTPVAIDAGQRIS